MRKILYLIAVMFLVVSFVSCNEKKEDENDLLYDEPGCYTYRVYLEYNDGSSLLDHMTYVEDAEYLTRPQVPERDGYEFEAWYTDEACTIPYDFSNFVTGSMILYAKWNVYSGPDFSFVLEQVPSTTSDNLELPTTADGYEGSTITWQTSDANTLSIDGLINPARVDTTVTLTMVVTYGQKRTSYHKEVTVKAIQFDELRENRIASGYYSYYNFRSNGQTYTESQKKLDIIYIAFGYVNYDCTIDMQYLDGDMTKYGQARLTGTRVVLSLKDGGDQVNFTQVAKDETNREKFAQAILDVIEKYHFDGIDVDWEYPGSSYGANGKRAEAEIYTEFMKAIYEKVKGANEDYLVTAAIPGGSEGFNRYNLEDCAQYMDICNLMTYDLNATGYAYHHSALLSNVGQGTMTCGGVIDSLELFVNRHFPIEKICIGIAFYGKINNILNNGELNYDKTTGTVKKTECDTSVKSITYSNIYSNYISKTTTGVYLLWDSTCMADYIYNSLTHQFICYDGVKAIEYKCKLANGIRLPNGNTSYQNYACKGVMVWDLGEDNTDTLCPTMCKYMGR